ncbi:P-loop containing nucleoside triphosphate hydrolase protein [Teratosphaeria nubilosa]|uniref:RNA helicase n=1 Tax=Teratosphaeria nubilosa TaxID=161662 RepID=A0A6G1KY51_9PEZI|nr:P-loop containing nucleoside triphosphate hydrolase protein [Teratosphaeria nubilosa]
MAQFKRRERKHKRLAKQKSSAGQDNAIPEVIIPETQTEREARRRTIAEELKSQQPESKVSSKKRKRLDKYIDTKLKKEENAELLRKLAAQKIDTSLLQSSKKLGRVNETKRERYSRALQEQAAGIASHDEILYQRRPEAASEEDDGQDDNSELEDLAAKAAEVPQASGPKLNFGGGLKRPLETDDNGQPVIKKRKRRKKGTVAFSRPHNVSDDDESACEEGGDVRLRIGQQLGGGHDEAGDGDDEWNGFDSDDQVRSNDIGDEHSDVSNASDDEDDEDDEELDSGEGGNEEGSDKGSDSESAPSQGDKRERVSAFKQWADSQRNAAVGFTSSTAPVDDSAIEANFRPRAPSPGPAAAAITNTNGERTTRPAAAITIPRSEEIQAARLKLPVVQEEQRIMEAIHGNPVVIVCGATGSGKTTQVPQMMFESGYGSHIGSKAGVGAGDETAGPQSKGLIGVTQPRRVAALSVADRVATELGSFKSRVAHQVRYDTNVSRDTAIKFMTDGILLREIGQDFILTKYSAIVIDEAHERSVNTDILIGMLSRIVNLRAELAKEDPEKHFPLKLVIMSATLRVADFAGNRRLFRSGAPPIVQAEGRQYPVTIHFSRRTQRDFVAETVNKVSRGHRKLPPGAMLVFLTSQQEIQTVMKQLKQKLGSNTAGYISLGDGGEHDDLEDSSGSKQNDYLEGEEDIDSDEDDEIKLDEDPEFDVPDDQPSFGGTSRGVLKPHILPLYAALPSAQQLKVFQPPADGSRLIVLATNVAETSLTIPGVRYVFDCGRAKEKRYDAATGVQTFEVDWISKASASQRSGRAGRTGPGHCYRLYSSAVYEQYFAEHTIPEILRTPLESTVLQLKAMDIENVVNFPFPTSPDVSQLQQAERLLKSLGAISELDGVITETGREIMAYPVSPRYGKMLLLARRNEMVPYTIAVVAALAVGEIFVAEQQVHSAAVAEEDEGAGSQSDSEDDDRQARHLDSLAQSAAQKRHQAYTKAQATLSRWDDQSDVVKLLTAVAAHAETSGKDKPMAAASKFCEEFFLREKGMQEVQQLRQQLHNIVAARDYSASRGNAHKDLAALPLPSEKERKMLNQIVAAGFIDQVAIRSDLFTDASTGFSRKPRRAIEVAYRPLNPSLDPTNFNNSLLPDQQELQRSVLIHPSSVLAHFSVKEVPSYIIYSHLSRAAASAIDSAKVPKTRMHPLCVVGPNQLAALAEGTPLLQVGKPVGKVEEVEGEGGRKRFCWVSVGIQGPGSGRTWPLTAWKVLQRRGRREWEIERVVAR